MKKDSPLINVAKKLRLYLQQHNISILRLSQQIPDIKYQTLKRMVEYSGDGSLPNLTSLISLAEFMNCSVSGLISDKLLLNIKCFSSIDKFLIKESEFIELQFPIDKFGDKLRISNIFALKSDTFFKWYTANNIPTHCILDPIQVFMTLNSIEYDGYYIVEIEDKIDFVKIVSVSTSTLMVEKDEKIVSISSSNVKIIAKFIDHGVIINDPNKLLIAYDK